MNYELAYKELSEEVALLKSRLDHMVRDKDFYELTIQALNAKHEELDGSLKALKKILLLLARDQG
jgi:hypothetical protein